MNSSKTNHKLGSAHIDSFYHLSQLEEETIQFCSGTACFAARHQNPARWSSAEAQEQRLYCLGKCFAAPSSTSDRDRPSIKSFAREPVVLGPILDGPLTSISGAISKGGYRALEEALNSPPEELISALEISGLRGRGGAGFPTGTKWRAVAEQIGVDKYVVANADEGDPGAYIDRFLLEDDPHRLIEAMTIAGYAIGANNGYVYLRKEYPQARTALEGALAEARREGFLGNQILRHSFSFEVHLVIGQGSYVCGEETALLNSIEGHRPEVRLRPPYPFESGLFGKPTLVNNVETLANIPWIVRYGGEAFKRIGLSTSRGTKLLSLNSLFCEPGLYEVEFGVSLRKIVEDLGEGLHSGELKALMIGGPLAGLLPPNRLDTPLGFEELTKVGASVGHGGVIAFDEHTAMADLIHHVFDFAAYESCGKCTPCRLGSRRIEQIFKQIGNERRAPKGAKKECADIVSALAATSLCGLGTGLADFARSALRHYNEELEPCFK